MVTLEEALSLADIFVLDAVIVVMGAPGPRVPGKLLDTWMKSFRDIETGMRGRSLKDKRDALREVARVVRTQMEGVG